MLLIVAFRAVRVPQHRRAWIILAVGLTLYGLGNVVWTVWYHHLASPPIPSIADGLWLALYPASYIGLVLLAREDNRAVPAGVWLAELGSDLIQDFHLSRPMPPEDAHAFLAAHLSRRSPPPGHIRAGDPA